MSKKKLIAIITIIVLLFAAGISVGVFLYGRGETEATDGTQTSDQGQVTDGNQDIQGSLADPTIDPETGDGETRTPDEGTVAGAEDNETIENDNQNANNENANNNENVNNTTNTGNNAGNNAGVTTDTNVDNVGETTISRVEEQERLVSKDFLDWWQPMTVSVKPTEVGVILPQITVQKTATVNDKISNLVYAGQDITYIVAVTNNGETAVENIEITDKIPENTAYVDGSIKDAFIAVIEDGKLALKTVEGAKNSVIKSEDVVTGLKWTVTIQAGETVYVSFNVNVNEGTTGTILNSAIANGEESNEVRTSIIRTHKSSVITRNNEQVETAKIGDLITYTISVENTGDVEGTTYIIDEVPAGTELVSAQEDSMEWTVTVAAHTTITREFTVKVTSVDGLIKNIAHVGGTPTNEDIIDTANIDVIKTATAVNGKIVTEDNPLQPVKVGDKIEYTIVVTNTGSRDLTNVLLEEQLEGVVVTKLVVDNIEKNIEKDVETGKLIIGELRAHKEASEDDEAIEAGVAVITAQYIVSYEKDIKGQGSEDGTTIPIYNKVIATGKTVTNPEDSKEVPEKVEDNADETVPVAEDPRFEVVKTAVEVKRVGESKFSALSGKVQDGDVVKYEIVVTNTGNTTLTNIKVTDTLNVRIDFEDGELKEVNPETGISTLKTIPSLVAGAKDTIITYYEVNQDDMILDPNQIEIIKNIVTAKPEELEEKQDEEIVPVNPYISRNVTKKWVGDEDNKYGTRPPQIIVRLYDDEVEVDVATITADQNWAHEFKMLPKYNEDGSVIVYTIQEDEVPYYAKNVPTTDMQEYIITNTLNQEMISVPVTKTWVDNENKYNTRPSQIVVRLWADEKEVQVATMTAVQNWAHVFTNLPKYNGLGNEIVYTITEDAIVDYDESIVVYNITNTLNPTESTSISGTKTWVDNQNAYSTRPPQITVNLMIGSTQVNTQVVTPNSNGEWKYSFTNLPTRDVNGNAITYSIQELSVTGYTSEIMGTNIKNTIFQQKISVEGTKTWIVPQRTTLPTVTVKLFRNGSQIATTTIDNITGKYIFSNLDKYDLTTGAEYEYTVEEVVPSGYTQVANDGRNFTNKINQEYITLRGQKTWYVPSSVTIPTIIVRVYQNGSQYVVNGTQVKSQLQPGTTTYSFAHLPKYSFTTLPNGLVQCTVNEYKIVEDKPAGFQDPVYSSITKNGNNWVQNITNKWAQEYITINVNKNWRDLGITSSRPTIYFDVYKTVGNGAEVKVEEKKLTMDNKTTSGSITGLEKYTISPDGITYTLNTYRVEERAVSKYTSSGPSVTTPITSNTTVSFTNTINQEYTASITATKVWNIPAGTTGATGIRICVYQNGKKMNGDDKYVDLTYNGNQTVIHTFSGLPKYNFKADGTVELYNYTVQEDDNAQYIATQSGNTITNTPKGIIQETVTNITTTTTASPVDVVFVLDVSNSMKKNNRITNMTAAVNSAMSTIMNHNSSNRVGIVAFSSNIYNVKTATLQNIQHNVNASITYDANYEDPNDDDREADGLLSGINGSITVKGATYTQTGIEKGAQMLINDTGNVTGRTPILILVTDGEPTWHNDDSYWDIGDKQGESDLSWDNNKGYNTSPKNVYYTILTANYWKEQIRQKYGIANVFTLGMDMDTRAAKATLEPTKTNIEGYSNLKNYFKNAQQNIENYNYADSSYMGSNITTNDLISKLNGFVNNSHAITTTTTKRMVTTQEISSKVVTLTNVDISKTFTITCANGNYTLETAKSVGIATQNGTTITVYLDKAGLTSQIYISYNK